MQSKGRVASCRAILYSFFAQAMTLPSAELTRGVCDGSLSDTVEVAFAGASPFHQRIVDDVLLTGLTSQDEEDVVRDQMLVEHTLLCGGQSVSPPYEADQLGGDAFRAVHVISDVAGFYATFGVQVSSATGERPDFIGVELDFMKMLCVKQSLALQRGNRSQSRDCRFAQQKFFRQHLSPWAGSFAQHLAETAKHQFHQNVGRLMAQFLFAEQSFLRVDGPQPHERPNVDLGVLKSVTEDRAIDTGSI